MTEPFSPLTQNILYCRDNGLLEDELGQSILRIYHAGVCDDHIAAMVAKIVSKHQFHQAFYGKIPFKPVKLTKGDYILGLDTDGNEIRSQIQYLNAHCLTVAGSGAGKTTFSRFKVLQIARHVGGSFLFDLRKREFAIMKPLLARVGVDLAILPGRNSKWNPLQRPLGSADSDWIPRVADMLIGVLELPPRASKLVQAKLFFLYRKFEGRDEYPTLFDLFEVIKQDKDSNYQARIAILDSLKPVLLSLGPDVLAYRHGWSSSELAKMHLVFELGGVSETDKNLLLNSLILSEFTSRIARGISNPKMDLWICLDEAQRLCSSVSQTSAIADSMGLVRGTGIGLDLSVQGTNRLLPEVLSNTATKILGRCGSIADYTAAGSSMGLTAEQIHWAQMNLTPGMFIGQLGEGLWRYPFIFRVPPMNLSGFSIEDHPDMGSTLNLPTVPAPEFRDWGRIPTIHSPSPETPEAKNPFDSPQEYQFCKAVVETPMLPSSQYHKLAGIGTKTAKQVRTQLVAKNYIREATLDSGKPGRSSILLEPLPEGIEAVRTYEETRK